MATTAGRGRRGRPPKAEAGDTKAALLEAALKLFAEHGYAGTSIRAIAREVGLSESVLYAHFASKRAIFDAVLEGLGPQSAVELFERVDMTLADTDPPRFVRLLVDELMDVWSTPEACRLISVMVRDGLIHDPEFRTAVLGALTHLAGQFATWMETGQVARDLGEPEDLAYALISPVAQARILWLHSAATPEDLAEGRKRAVRHADLFARAVFR